MAIGRPQPIQKLAVGQRLYNFGFTDSVLFTEAYMRPRYKGSKLIGAKINEYTDYSQLNAAEYSSRLYNDVSTPGGIFPGFVDDWKENNFIRTTKPIDGSFPPLFEFTKSTPTVISYINDNRFKGNYAPFPIPGSAMITTDTAIVFGRSSPFQSKKDVFKQNGTLFENESSAPLGEIIAFGNGLAIWECQYMGGYRRDRSYGRNPVIEVKTSTIYEFDWGGSTYPEVEKGGSVHIKQILNVDSYAKGNPNVYIVNEATNDSFRIDTATVDGQGVSTLIDNPGEETDFSINFKRSLSFGDRITLNSYIAGTPTVNGPESVVGSINDLVEEVNAFPVKNIITLEPGLGIPSYRGIYTRRKIGSDSNVTSSITGEPIGVPFLPRFEDGETRYVQPSSITFDPHADFYMADFQNPGGPEVLASTLRNVSGSYYYPSTVPNSNNAGVVQTFTNNSKGKGAIIINQDKTKYLKISPEGEYITGSGAYVKDSSVYTELSSSLAKGNRHFVSFYETLGNKAVGDLNQINEPIEINSVEFPSSETYIYLKSTPLVTGVIGSNGGFGMLVWKAQQGSFVIMKPTDTAADYSYRFLRTGGFYREYSTTTIKQHFDDIVKTVGMKPSL